MKIIFFLSLRGVGGINSTNAYDIHGDSEYKALKALCAMIEVQHSRRQFFCFLRVLTD